MSIISAVRPVRNVVLFDSSDRRPSPRFGAGILRAVPSYRLPCTLDDAAWFADQQGNRELYRHLDEMHAEAVALEAYQNGCLPL